MEVQKEYIMAATKRKVLDKSTRYYVANMII